jgi:hypothetical protein
MEFSLIAPCCHRACKSAVATSRPRKAARQSRRRPKSARPAPSSRHPQIKDLSSDLQNDYARWPWPAPPTSPRSRQRIYAAAFDADLRRLRTAHGASAIDAAAN